MQEAEEGEVREAAVAWKKREAGEEGEGEEGIPLGAGMGETAWLTLEGAAEELTIKRVGMEDQA